MDNLHLQSVWPRADQAARYQEQSEQQGNLRHQLAYYLQQQEARKEKQVQMPFRTDGKPVEDKKEREQERRKRRLVPRGRPAPREESRGAKPGKGENLDQEV